MNHITTFTGKHFYPTDPDITKIDIRDIAHALSMTCRGNGHVKTFFSVGQHCINCAREAKLRGLSNRMVLACLLHDASEAYMSDVPRPFKHMIPEYIAIEERLLAVIYEKFLGSPLTGEEERMLKIIDDDLLYYDMEELLKEPFDREPPKLHITLNYQFIPFGDVEREYLEVYESCKKELTNENNRALI